MFVADSSRAHASAGLQKCTCSLWLTAIRPSPITRKVASLMTCQQEFQLAAYQGDAGGQLAALHKCAALSSVAADTFLELCELSRGAQQVPLLKTQRLKPITAAAVRLLMTKHPRLHHQCSYGK